VAVATRLCSAAVDQLADIGLLHAQGCACGQLGEQCEPWLGVTSFREQRGRRSMGTSIGSLVAVFVALFVVVVVVFVIARRKR
jgi:hypothetical protein